MRVEMADLVAVQLLMKAVIRIIQQEQEAQTEEMELVMVLTERAKVQLPVHGDRQQEHCMLAVAVEAVDTLNQEALGAPGEGDEEGTDTQPEPQERPILAVGPVGPVTSVRMSA